MLMKKQFQSLTEKGRWLLATLTLLFTLGIGQMWGDTFSASEIINDSGAGTKKNHVTACSPGITSTSNQQIWVDGGSAKKEATVVISADASNSALQDRSGSYIEIKADDGYTLGTTIGIRGGGKGSAAKIAPVVWWSGTVSSTFTGAKLDLSLPANTITSSAAADLVVTIPSGMKVVRIYRKVRLNKDAHTTFVNSGQYDDIGGGSAAISSVTATAVADCTKPGTPTSLAAGSVTHNSASLSWTAGSNSNGHKIYIEKKSDKTKVLDWTDATNSYSASGLTAETTYTFKVKAKGATGYCDLGDEASADFTTGTDPAATTYKVTLVPAGGTISDATGWTLNAGNYEKEVSDGTELALPTFTKDNRTFKTWRNGAVDVTSPITVTADVTLTAVWNATVENVIYSWEGAQGGATEVGGTAVGHGDEGLVNTLSEGYYCLRMNGNTSYDKYIEITLSGEEKVKTGDKITYWGFYSNEGDKNAAPKMRDGNSPNTQIFADATNLPKIYGGSGTPAQRTFTVPADINTNKVQLTRNKTGSSTMMPKIQIVRETYVEEANIRTVTFNYNDGGATANKVVEVVSGSTVSAEAAPSYAHHRFHEWQLGGVAYDFATAVTTDITLVADWKQLYTVTYAKGEESATGDAPTQDELAAGEKFTVAVNPFAYEGHDFSTWNDGSADVAPGTEYTMGSANVTLTAQWITATTKVTVTYKDGETTLGSEEITINTGNPVGYATYQTRNLATFDGWYNDPDLAEGHKIADISALTASANVNVYGKWNYKYASSTNIEQWTLTNGAGKGSTTKTSALISLLGTNNFASNLVWENGNIELDSLDDAKGDRNEPYLGLKVKSGGKMLDFRVANGQTVKVKFGAIKSTLPQVSLNGGDYANMSLTEKVWSYTATGNDYISIKTADANAVVFKQIMINEDLQTVTLPWRVTYNANGGTCATAEAIWSGAALILPDVTPAEPADYTFAGWYDELAGGTLQGEAGASYTPTDNETLYAHFAPVEYAINYNEGEHGETAIVVAYAGWGTEYTAIANPFTPETGWIFSGWAVIGVDGVSSIAAGGSFTMPKNAVTLTAQWIDNSKVAMIVETSAKYESLAEAIAAATDGQTVQLLQDIDVTAQVEVAEKAITLDLAGYKIEYTGASTLPSGVILVHNGASLTINDSSDPDAGAIISGDDAYAAIALTKAGDDATNPAILEINGGTFSGFYYAITGHGSRHNTQITINDGTFVATSADDGLGIYHPQQGTLTINGGTFTAYLSAIEMRAGTLVINDGTFTSTATTYSCNPSGSGSTTTGAAIAIAQHTTQKNISVTINGGTFNGVKAINEANPQGNPAPAVAMSITDGDFTGEVSTVDVHEFISGGTYDAAVANENCAPGYVPSAEVAPGVYTVVPKDGVEIIGVVVTGNTTGDVSGLYKGTATVNLNDKKIDSGKYIYVTLKDGYSFEENDVLIVDVNTKSNLDGGTKALEITTGVGNIDGDVWKSIAYEDYTTGENIISLEGIAAGQTSIGLKRSANQNAKINGLRVLRPMKPMLTAITIDGRDGVIDEANKTVAAQIPYEADLAALTVVPTIAWNEPAATNSIVVNDGSAWIEGANTYKLTDKDGDYTVYTITLTRDVLKHTVSFNTHGGSAVANELVVHGEYLAAAPAAPTKEDYIFQYWSETEDGAEVDVTTVQINADKEFHAVWASDGGIKLLNGSTVNHTNFITAVTADETVEFQGNTVNYAKFSGTVSGVNGVKDLTRVIAYNATTNKTKIRISAHNNSTSGRNILVKGLVEGADAAVDLATIALGNKEDKVSDWIEFDNAANRTIYIMVSSSAGDVYFTQVKVIESGETPMKQAGEAGYSLNLNKGRFFGTASTDLAFEGMNARLSGDYTALNSGYAKLTSTSMSFTVATPMLLKVTTNNNKTYYVTKGAAGTDNETAKTGESEFDLTAGTWYITAGTAEVQITNIAFVAPKCAEPAFNALANSDVCAGDGYVALDGTATIADAGVPTYQWYREDDSAIDGETNATYTPSADGKYYVIAVNHLAGYTDNEKKSDLVTVTTHAGTAITAGLAHVRKTAGEAATLTVEATGKNLHYAWKESETIDGTYTDVAGATDNKSLDIVVPDGIKYYKVIVSSDCGDAQESIAKVEKFVPVSQVVVNTSVVWDLTTCADAEIKLTDLTSPKKGEECLMANIEGVHMDENFHSESLVFAGEYIYRTSVGGAPTCATYMKFETSVAGLVRVHFAGNGSNRCLRITSSDNVQYSSVSTGTGNDLTEEFEVAAGEIELMGMNSGHTSDKQYMRFFQIEFYALAHQRTSGYNAGDLGTVILEDATFIKGANLYELAGLNENGYLAFDEIQSGELEAGKPYLFEVTNPSNISFYKPVGAAHSDTEIETNGMIGTFAGTTLYQGADNYYYFSGRHIWKVNDFTVAIPIPAHRCYVDMDVLQTTSAPSTPAYGRRRVTLGVQGTQVATGIEDIDASEKPVKLLINGQMYILRGEKLFDATGRLVK